MNKEHIEKLKKKHNYAAMSDKEKKMFDLYVLFWSSDEESKY